MAACNRSGPTSMDGTSMNSASLIVVDLKTGGDTANGGLKKIFTLPGGNAFANEPVVLDKSMNYDADAVYVGANYATGTSAGTSEVFRLRYRKKTLRNSNRGKQTAPRRNTSTTRPIRGWKVTRCSRARVPITASGTLSVDRKDNVWLYLGTGRFLTLSDETDTNQNCHRRHKDPFFNPDLPACNY